MSYNPFTNPTKDHYNRGTPSRFPGRYIWIILVALIVLGLGAGAFWALRLLSHSSLAINRDSMSAYFVGHPWNGQIVYRYYYANAGAVNAVFGLYDTQTETYRTLANLRTDVEPTQFVHSVEKEKLVLWDYYGQESIIIDLRTGHTQEGPPAPADEDSLSEIQYTYDRENGGERAGMSREGEHKTELSRSVIRKLGLTDFKNNGLKDSYWVYDIYARKDVTDTQTGAQLVLIEMSNSPDSYSTTGFFGLVDRRTMRTIRTGYPDHTFYGKPYLSHYVLNCMQEDENNLLVLTRDQVLRVYLPTCSVEVLQEW